jgi:hypothetical protein
MTEHVWERQTREESIAELRGAIYHANSAFDRGCHIPDEHVDAAHGGLALLRAMVVHASAIVMLPETPLAEAASANLRSMFEAWTQLIFLFDQKDQNEAGRRYELFALLEFLAFVEEHYPNEPVVATLRTRVDTYRRDHPKLLRSVERQRADKAIIGPGKKTMNRGYRTGLGPSVLAKQVAPVIGRDTDLSRYYKTASREAHHILTPVLNVKREESGDGCTLPFGPPMVAEDFAKFHCHTAARMLSQRWRSREGRLRLTLHDPAPGVEPVA